MKEFELVHGLKVIGKTDKQVLEVYEFDGYWYLASAKSLWNINQFNPEDFEIYKGAVDVGGYDLEYNVTKMKKYYITIISYDGWDRMLGGSEQFTFDNYQAAKKFYDEVNGKYLASEFDKKDYYSVVILDDDENEICQKRIYNNDYE